MSKSTKTRKPLLPARFHDHDIPGREAILEKDDFGFILKVYHSDILVFEVPYGAHRSEWSAWDQAKVDSVSLLRGMVPPDYLGPGFLTSAERAEKFSLLSIK